MTRRGCGVVIGAAVLVALMAAGAAFTYYQWKECRDMGFSRFYCLKHIS